MNNDTEFIAKRRFQAEYRRNPEWKPLREYFAAAKTGDAKTIIKHLDAGISVNAVEPTTTFTALHYAASQRSDMLLETLLDQPDIDNLKRDGLGRLASELAGACAGDMETARRLRTLELWQARNQGIILTFAPR